MSLKNIKREGWVVEDEAEFNVGYVMNILVYYNRYQQNKNSIIGNIIEIS